MLRLMTVGAWVRRKCLAKEVQGSLGRFRLSSLPLHLHILKFSLLLPPGNVLAVKRQGSYLASS